MGVHPYHLVARLPWEANQIRADAETCARSCLDGHSWDVRVEDAERGGRRKGDERHLVHVEVLLRDGEGRNSNHQSLDQILDRALEELTKVEVDTGHLIDRPKKKRVTTSILGERRLNLFCARRGQGWPMLLLDLALMA